MHELTQQEPFFFLQRTPLVSHDVRPGNSKVSQKKQIVMTFWIRGGGRLNVT